MDDPRDAMEQAIEALERAHAALAPRVTGHPAWAALRQLDEREAGGDLVAAIDRMELRQRLSKQLTDVEPDWRLLPRIEAALAALGGARGRAVRAVPATLPRNEPAPAGRVVVIGGDASASDPGSILQRIRSIAADDPGPQAAAAPVLPLPPPPAPRLAPSLLPSLVAPPPMGDGAAHPVSDPVGWDQRMPPAVASGETERTDLADHVSRRLAIAGPGRIDAAGVGERSSRPPTIAELAQRRVEALESELEVLMTGAPEMGRGPVAADVASGGQRAGHSTSLSLSPSQRTPVAEEAEVDIVAMLPRSDPPSVGLVPVSESDVRASGPAREFARSKTDAEAEIARSLVEIVDEASVEIVPLGAPPQPGPGPR